MSLIEKLTKIEALIQRGTSEGERQAAQLAKERFLAKVSEQKSSKPIEYKVSLDSPWKKRLFIALCSKHGLRTYRYPRQKYTTARLTISKCMMDEVLWPEFQQYAKMLEELVGEVMQDLINKIHSVQEEVEIAGEIGFYEGASISV